MLRYLCWLSGAEATYFFIMAKVEMGKDTYLSSICKCEKVLLFDNKLYFPFEYPPAMFVS